jgi:hypothetical protein
MGDEQYTTGYKQPRPVYEDSTAIPGQLNSYGG